MTQPIAIPLRQSEEPVGYHSLCEQLNRDRLQYNPRWAWQKTFEAIKNPILRTTQTLNNRLQTGRTYTPPCSVRPLSFKTAQVVSSTLHRVSTPKQDVFKQRPLLPTDLNCESRAIARKVQRSPDGSIPIPQKNRDDRRRQNPPSILLCPGRLSPISEE